MSPKPKCSSCGATLAADAPEGLCPRCLMALNLATQTEERTGPIGPNGTQVIKPPPAPPPSPEEVAKLFPQLEILECLGRGGMGVVYKARQPRLDRVVALKILAQDRAADPKFAERFEREARALARLNHPNILSIHDFGESAGRYYLLMEYVDGMNLRELIRTRKMTPEQALAVVPNLCEALQYAHGQGIVHRDIKPENILLDTHGQVKIADFGIAKILGYEARDHTLTEGKQVIGTPHYMAPEQVEKPQTVDHRADIYSLGVVFYEMLTGELPLGKFAPPSQKVQVDVRLDHIVLRTLEKEPDRRYQHAGDVKTDVETVVAHPRAAAPSLEITERGKIIRQVRGPAIGLLATGVLNWLLIPLAVVFLMREVGPQGLSNGGMAALGLITLFLCGFMIFAALRFKRLEAYGLALAASLLAVVVTPGNLVGLPVGIWSLAVLTRREVRCQFAPSRPLANALALLVLVLAVGVGVLAYDLFRAWSSQPFRFGPVAKTPHGQTQIKAVAPERTSDLEFGPVSSVSATSQPGATGTVPTPTTPKEQAPGPAPNPLALPPAPFALDTFLALLDPDQRLILNWTDRQFRSYFDDRTFAGMSDLEKADLETRLIDALRGPRTREYYQAINTLAALRSPRALAPLLTLAVDRREKDNRDRWMAVRGLGILGDASVVPELIHLVYYPNLNTRWWAQLSLVQLTSTNFGRDWEAWGQWWTAQGRAPAWSPQPVPWTTNAEWMTPKSLAESDRLFFEKLQPKAPR